jgi:phosphoenolpyruvate carboxylase
MWELVNGSFVTITNRPVNLPDWFDLYPTEASGSLVPQSQWRIPAFLTMGSWIGGDRDGNPYVTHDVTRYALARQSAMSLEYYLEQVQQLRSELAQSVRLVQVTQNSKRLPRARPTTPSTAAMNRTGAL